jgi:purine-binding chemotaxis protein CheW
MSAPLRGRARLVAFRLDSQQYALELHVVERVLPMATITPLPGAPAVVLGALNLHGAVCAVFDVRRRFGLPARPAGLGAQLLVARTAGRQIALPVDEVLGVFEVAEADITPASVAVPGVLYVRALLALPGGLLLIHDLTAFLSPDEDAALESALKKATE